ncbi:MAG: pyridoxamine 5'-phosphate oxidase [Candidatus Binataceae bacterium]
MVRGGQPCDSASDHGNRRRLGARPVCPSYFDHWHKYLFRWLRLNILHAGDSICAKGRCSAGRQKNMATQDPIKRFNHWFKQELVAGTRMPEAMVLATGGRNGVLSVRYVLLKQADEQGFGFYTDIRSPKGQQIKQNAHAALAFYWPRRGRQVRIEGSVEPMTTREADGYWITRPRASQLSATASRQSHPLRALADLLARVSKLRRELQGKYPPRPEYWLCLRVVPKRIEFWVQGSFRLHRRELYVRDGRRWRMTLLQP